MSLLSKLQKLRNDLQNANLKKSGHNKYADFKYYELCDILPTINKLCLENKLATIFNTTKETATLLIIDYENTEIKELKFEIPFALPIIKGANDVQNLGGALTYLRRYLFLQAFEIVENDTADAVIGKDIKPEESLPTDFKVNPGDKCPYCDAILKLSASGNIYCPNFYKTGDAKCSFDSKKLKYKTQEQEGDLPF